jgi:hypothetical protein
MVRGQVMAKAFFRATRKKNDRKEPAANKESVKGVMASRTYTNYKCWRGINTSPDSKRAARIIRLTAKSKLPTRTLKSAARGQETTYNISLLIYVLIYWRTLFPNQGERTESS